MGSSRNVNLFNQEPESRQESDISTSFPLPVPEGPLAQTILLSAGAELWKSHLFLSAWCQQTEPARTQLNGSTGPIVIFEDDDEEEEDLERRETITDASVSPTSEGSYAQSTMRTYIHVYMNVCVSASSYLFSVLRFRLLSQFLSYPINKLINVSSMKIQSRSGWYIIVHCHKTRLCKLI